MRCPSEPAPLKAVLQKARVILECFDAATPVLGVTELSRRSGLPKTTARRLAQELVACELLERGGDRYRLGPWLFELGQRVPAHRKLRVAAAPFLEDLAHTTHEIAVLATPGHREILFSEKYVGTRGRGQVVTEVDGRVPLHCGASGKCVLAFGPEQQLADTIEAGLPRRTPFTITTAERLRGELAQVRELGYAVDRQELVLGYGAVAAPVWCGSRVQATLAVITPISRLDVPRFSTAVRLAANALSRSARLPVSADRVPVH